MSNIPVDLIADVLSRLPVKPLLRFRCVSKPWCALIDSPDFIKSHLNRSLSTKFNHTLIFRYFELHSVDFDSLNHVEILYHPMDYPEFGIEILGSCNGLLCLYDGKNDIALWNPSTRKCRMLPVAYIECPENLTFLPCVIYGFGYDLVNDDYKVVRIMQFYGKNSLYSFESEVKVYSLRSHSWRRIKGFPYFLRYPRAYGEFVLGAVHWVVTKNPQSDQPNLIAAFDLGNEECRLVPQPDSLGDNFHMNVGVLEGCLSMVCSYMQVYVDVWVMKEYGVKDSWVKLFSVSQPEVIRPFKFVMPIVYSKSGYEILLVQDNKMLLWYDLESKRVKDIHIQGMPNTFEMNVCVGSLVPLNRTGGIGEKKQPTLEKKEPKKNVKKRDGFLSKGFKLVL